MKKIYDFSGEQGYRNYTIKDLFQLKGKKKLTQINVKNTLEAKIAVEANIDLLITSYKVVKEIRNVAKNKFITAAIPFTEFKTNDDILSASLNALEEGADAIYTARSPHVVEYLSNESIPVMAHLGLVPRKSIISGGLRAFGKTHDEALILLKNFKNMENAGAFSVEAEVIAEKTLEFISQNCKLITISLGSGNYADVNYLFMEDICGENRNLPRHAFSFAKTYKLQDKIYNEKLKAVKKYRKIAKTNKFAPQDKIAQINSKNLEIFKKKAIQLLNK